MKGNFIPGRKSVGLRSKAGVFLMTNQPTVCAIQIQPFIFQTDPSGEVVHYGKEKTRVKGFADIYFNQQP
jgi:hypothetical protein